MGPEVHNNRICQRRILTLLDCITEPPVQLPHRHVKFSGKSRQITRPGPRMVVFPFRNRGLVDTYSRSKISLPEASNTPMLTNERAEGSIVVIEHGTSVPVCLLPILV